ncbi:MAG: YdeI/OmpD-associated family protein [Candidatus Dormibacteria bacterium]
MPADEPALLLSDAAAWDDWLAANGDRGGGVWLVIAKKGHTEPTTLGFDDALDIAIAHGWVDVQNRRRDDATYLLRFTPRRPRSSWGANNVRRVERLATQGRMRPGGIAAVERAKAEGRWPTVRLSPDRPAG